jgi:hypothetical protein
VLFIDDQLHNVRGAYELGLQVVQATDDPRSLLGVDQLFTADDACEPDLPLSSTGARR